MSSTETNTAKATNITASSSGSGGSSRPALPSKDAKDLPAVLTTSLIEEQETLISWSRGDDRAKIYTSSNITLTKIRKLMGKSKEYRIESISYINGAPAAVTVSCPLNAVSLRTGEKRNISDERRAALRDQLKKINGTRSSWAEDEEADEEAEADL